MSKSSLVFILFIFVACTTTDNQSFKPKQNKAVSQLIIEASQAIRNENTKLAQSHLQRALRISPKDAEIYYLLAKVQWKEKAYSDALGLLDRSFSYVGNYKKLEQKIWVLRSVVYDSLNMPKKSNSALEKADAIELILNPKK